MVAVVSLGPMLGVGESERGSDCNWYCWVEFPGRRSIAYDKFVCCTYCSGNTACRGLCLQNNLGLDQCMLWDTLHKSMHRPIMQMRYWFNAIVVFNYTAYT